MLKALATKINVFIVIVIFAAGWSKGVETWESEKLALEVNMQKRIDDVLSKILSRQDYVVVVQIEPWEQQLTAKPQAQSSDNIFFLPGVPARRTLDGSGEAVKDLVDTLNMRAFSNL